jgi:hypothetical protein
MPQNLQLHLVDYDDSSSNLGVTYFRMLHFLMSQGTEALALHLGIRV